MVRIGKSRLDKGASVNFRVFAIGVLLLVACAAIIGQVPVGNTVGVPAPTLDLNSTTAGDVVILRLINTPTSAGANKVSLDFRANESGTPNASFSVGRIYGKFDAGAYTAGRITIASPTNENTFTDTLSVKNARVQIGTTTDAGSKLTISGLATYADNSAATSGGLSAGALYRTSTGVLMIVY